jgi:hypothetical protein
MPEDPLFRASVLGRKFVGRRLAAPIVNFVSLIFRRTSWDAVGMSMGLSRVFSRYQALTAFTAVLGVTAAARADGDGSTADPASAPPIEAISQSAPIGNEPAAAPAAPIANQKSTTDTATGNQLQSDGAPASDARDDAPVIALTHSAFGTRANKIGAQMFGFGQTASGGSEGGGGLMIHGSPLDRLTLMATGQRYADGHFAPSASIAYRMLGSLDEAWSLAAMGTYKAEGFAEIEGEVELGVLFSILKSRWHFDVNAVAGGGFEESEELDAEAKVRAGYDVADWLRIGADARGRYRLRGDKLLAGARQGDVIGGPQIIARWSRFYGAALMGVSTVDVASGAGAVGWLSVGGTIP